MNQETLIKNVLAGKPCVVVEYRSFKLDTITYIGKKSGVRESKPVIKHAIELADTQAAITEWLPDGADLAQVKPNFKKGEKCVLTLEGIETVQGFASIKGKLEPLDAK